jgi:hypothetical protein
MMDAENNEIKGSKLNRSGYRFQMNQVGII